MNARGVFVTGTGTGVGKTEVGVRLCKLLRDSGQTPVALKPIETGVKGLAEDAVRLAEACGRLKLADSPGFYRAAPSVAPWAATLAGQEPLDVGSVREAVVRVVDANASSDTFVLIEGAGGPLVPLTETETVADLCVALNLPAILVSRDSLGTLSHTLTAFESLERKGVTVRAVVLNRFGSVDESQEFNQAILNHWLPVPIYRSERLESLIPTLLASP